MVKGLGNAQKWTSVPASSYHEIEIVDQDLRFKQGQVDLKMYKKKREKGGLWEKSVKKEQNVYFFCAIFKRNEQLYYSESWHFPFYTISL